MPTTLPLPKQRDRTDRLLASMNKALREKCLAVRQLLARETRGTIRAHYRIGLLVSKVRSAAANRYGAGAVERLAEAVGLDRATIYDHVTVAERFTPSDIKALLKRKGRQGVPLSWSHLVELAKVIDKGRREKLIAAALQEGLSVRKLMERIEESSSEESEPEQIIADEDELPAPSAEAPPHDGSASPRPKPAFAPAVLNGLQEMTALGKSWVDQSTRWQAEIFRPILTANTASLDAQLLDRLEQARQAQLRLRDVCDENLRQLDRIVADHSASAPQSPAANQPGTPRARKTAG